MDYSVFFAKTINKTQLRRKQNQNQKEEQEDL